MVLGDRVRRSTLAGVLHSNYRVRGAYEARLARLPVAAGVEDGTRLRVMGEPEDDHLLVRVSPGPRDSRLIRWAATALLGCAVALLVYFLVWA